jgi:YHS domain-containing protein
MDDLVMFSFLPRRAVVIHWFLAIALLACATGFASAQGTTPDADTVIPLEGLDPVMLSQGKEVQGDMKHQVRRGQFRYIFANAENKAEFEKDSSRYEIQLNGYCARMGAPTTANPDLYAVHKGRIYVFGSEECQTVFKAGPEKYLEVPAEPKSPPTAEMVKRGGELIAKAVEALGGSKLDQLVSFQRKELRGNDVKNTLLLAFPEGMRQETVRPNFTLVSVVTPSESFVALNNTARPMPAANRTAIDKELLHEPIILLRARNRSDFKAWAHDGEQRVGLVEIELPGFNTTLAIDPVTGRVLGQIYRGRGPGGVVGEIEIHYSDFRAAEGPVKDPVKELLFPFKITTTFDGQPFPALSAIIEATTVNGQIDPDSFKKPTK